jgi:hypothetical protein
MPASPRRPGHYDLGRLLYEWNDLEASAARVLLVQGRRAAAATHLQALHHHTERGETILTGDVADQPALYGLIARLRDLDLPLISVDSVEVEDTE